MSERQKAAARVNGHFGGPPTKEMVRLRKIARDHAVRLLSRVQRDAVEFLIWGMDNPNWPPSLRVQCAVEILNRGEVPAKSASYVGVGTIEDMDAAFNAPKIVIIGKFTDSKAEVLHEPAEASSSEAPALRSRNGENGETTHAD